jgi:hypothetical protein
MFSLTCESNAAGAAGAAEHGATPPRENCASELAPLVPAAFDALSRQKYSPGPTDPDTDVTFPIGWLKTFDCPITLPTSRM